jgi:Icc-related predicted phosphoesterase
MRLLLVSDLHYALRQYDWLLAAAARFDVVAVAGDHVDAALGVPPDVQIAALSATLTALAGKTQVLACSGNHDLNARSAAGEKVADWLAPRRAPGLAVDGDTLEVAGTLFTICPWWDGPHARDGVESLLAGAARRRSPGQRWIWVYHAPPEGPLSWSGKRHFGDPALPALVERHAPTAVLCGHIHQAPFVGGGGWAQKMGATWLFNAGRQIGEVPARVEIDFDALTARWVSIEGIEDLVLG